MIKQEKYGYVCDGDLVAEFKKYDTKRTEDGKAIQSKMFHKLETIGEISKTVI